MIEEEKVKNDSVPKEKFLKPLRSLKTKFFLFKIINNK